MSHCNSPGPGVSLIPGKITMIFIAHRIHVWYIYLHMGDVDGKYTSPMDPMGWDLPKKFFSRNTGNLRFPGWSCHDCMLDATCFGTCWICLVSGETRWLVFSNADLSWLKKNIIFLSKLIISDIFEMFLKLFYEWTIRISDSLRVQTCGDKRTNNFKHPRFGRSKKWRCHLHFLKIQIHRIHGREDVRPMLLVAKRAEV